MNDDLIASILHTAWLTSYERETLRDHIRRLTNEANTPYQCYWRDRALRAEEEWRKLKHPLNVSVLRSQVGVVPLDNLHPVPKPTCNFEYAHATLDQQAGESVTHDMGSYAITHSFVDEVLVKGPVKVVAVDASSALRARFKREGGWVCRTADEMLEKASELLRDGNMTGLAVFDSEGRRVLYIHRTSHEIEPACASFDNLSFAQAGVEAAEQNEA